MIEQKKLLRKKYAPQPASRQSAWPRAAQSLTDAVSEAAPNATSRRLFARFGLHAAANRQSFPARLRARPLQRQRPAEADQAAEQERRRAVLAGLFARAQALVPDPPDSPTRKACREAPVDKVITEKLRRQGFHL